MKKSKFSELQISSALKKQEAGITVKEICKEMGISEPTFYNWKKIKFVCSETNNPTKIKEIERENAELKKMYVELCIENRIIKSQLEKNIRY